jgi:hypothetical protein
LPFALGATAAFWVAVFWEPEATGWGDWQFFHHMWEVGRVGLERHGALPLWDAHHCGGITLWGNPQAQVYGPFFWLSPLVGSTLAIKLYLAFHVFAAFHGMALLARRHGLSVRGAMVASLAFGGSGYLAWHLAGGHAPFAPFAFTPWLLAAWQRAPAEPRFAAVVALLMGLTLWEGGVYPLPYFVLLLAFDALTRLHRERLRLVWVGAGAAILALLLCAGRLIPILDTLAEHPRETDLLDRLDGNAVWSMLMARTQPEHPVGAYSWPEYGAYLGPIVLLLALFGLARAWKKERVWIVGLLVFGALMLGNKGPLSPWRLIHHLPVYDSLRVPSRFMIFVTFYLALLAGAGLDQLLGRLRSVSGASAAGATLVVVLLAFDLLSVNGRTIDRWEGAPITDDPPAERFHLSALPYSRYADFPQLNVGTGLCYDPMNVPRVPGLRTGDRAQAWLRGDGSITALGRGLDHVWAEVTMDRPGRMVVNQRGGTGWVLGEGSAATIDRESLRLELEVPAGSHRIDLRYRPPKLGLALGLSATGLGASLLWWLLFTLRRRNRRPVVKADPS